jgi:putative peptide zinc metalloprotease protein
VYRFLVVIAILLFLGNKFPVLTVTFTVIVAVTMIGVPFAKAVSYLFTDPRLEPVRLRALMTTAALIVGLTTLLCIVPAPFHTVAEGVVWLPDEAFVRAGADGFSCGTSWSNPAPGAGRGRPDRLPQP